MSSADQGSHGKGQEQEEYIDLMKLSDDPEYIAPSQHPQSRTLLPGPVASVVSGFTGISSLSVRVGTKVGGWWIYAGREATLKTLSVSKSALETVLVAAGRDVSARSTGELGRAEAEGMLEKSISALHSSISAISFFASTGFYLTEASMNSISGLSIQGLSTLNAILGSTESSRAVAAIITLIRDELNRPDGSKYGEVVSYRDLLVGAVGFVLLQRWARRQTERDFIEAGGEETIWDTVIDDKGFRADVVGTRRKDVISLTPGARAHPFAFGPEDDGSGQFDAFEKAMLLDTPQLGLSPEDQTNLTDEEIRDRIMAQLPPGTRAVISSETLTAKTIKVDIFSSDTTHIEAPPGTVMVAERHNPDATFYPDGRTIPRQTIVFRTALNKSTSSEIEPDSRQRSRGEIEDAADNMDHEGVFMMDMRPSKIPRPLVRIDPIPIADDGPEHDNHIEDDIPLSKSKGPTANQKKPRKPISATPKQSSIPRPLTKTTTFKTPSESTAQTNRIDKGGALRKAIRALSSNSSTFAAKDARASQHVDRPPPTTIPSDAFTRLNPTASRDKISLNIYPPLTPHSAHSPLPSPVAYSPQPTPNYFTVRERRRDSSVSQTETYSVHSVDSRPGSPSMTRVQSRVMNGLTSAKSEVGLSVRGNESRPGSSQSTLNHHRSKSFLPSLYSMASKHSNEAIVLAPKIIIPRKSIYEDNQMLAALAANGTVPGMFPNQHLVTTIRRFSRFASASYGAQFLRVMGLTPEDARLSAAAGLTPIDIPHQHSAFSNHTGLPSDTILLSSFFDPQGVTGNTEWSPSAISPLIHFICIDHDAKAVVLTCRGTLGFEDVLTDMTCDYDDITFRGQTYQVHKGIHASARRLLGGDVSRVMVTIKNTLEKHADYGLILCGHSLGGAVAAILAVLISEPSDKDEHSFVTCNGPKLITQGLPDSGPVTYVPPVNLPTGRPIHVYAYGPPASVSEPLRLATRGLITTIVNNADIVPSLSLGILHDFRTMALHLKHDTNDAMGNLKSRVWRRLRSAISSAFYVDKDPPPPENTAGDGLGEDTWAWSALSILRASMTNSKLVPPGEVFLVETTRVFDRLDPDVAREAMYGSHDDSEKMYRALGRPATRVKLKLIRDVETWFGELRFGRDMFGDHSPGRYEASLAALEHGICEN